MLSVSHELKTPVASISLFLETLQKRKLDERQRIDIYNRSLSEVNRLNHLIGDILTAQNIENDNYFIDKKLIQLDDYLKDRLLSLDDTLMRNHTLNLSTIPVKLNIDIESLDSIIHNLVGNACKYAPFDSQIDVSLTQNNGSILLTISDEGPGIEEESLSLSLKSSTVKRMNLLGNQKALV